MTSPLPSPGSAAAIAAATGFLRCSCRWLLASLAAASLGSLSTAAAAPVPHRQAVADSEAAARAVLDRAGVESCLRGKLTGALLRLSSSCEAGGEPSALCSLADRAVVVTPMTLPFMEDTSRQLLDLLRPSGSPDRAAAGRPATLEQTGEAGL